MRNSPFFRATVFFTLFCLLSAAVTLPQIFSFAGANHLGISSIHLLLQACLLILGVLITRKIARGYMVHGFTALILSNIFYAAFIFECRGAGTPCPQLYSIDASWYVRSTTQYISIIDTLPLFLAMNALLISFLFWLERHRSVE